MMRSTRVSNIIRRTRQNKLPVLAMVALCLAAGGCSDRVKGVVQQELPQPGGGFTAIFAKDVGHFTTSDVYYDLYLRWPKDGYTERVFSVTDFDEDPKIRWQTHNALVIHMACGTIRRYQNEFEYNLWNANASPVFLGLEGNRLCKHSGEAVPSL